MKHAPYPPTPHIRFSRWSRKGYAMFCSLGRYVTISTLKGGVLERAQDKVKGAILSLSIPFESGGYRDYYEPPLTANPLVIVVDTPQRVCGDVIPARVLVFCCFQWNLHNKTMQRVRLH